MSTIRVIVIKNKPDVLKGGMLGWYPQQLSAAWKHARQTVKDDPTKAIIEDIESGYPQIVSKEQHQKYIEMRESLQPKVSDEIAGKIVMFGTGGAVDKNNDFLDMFINPGKQSE